MPPGPTCDEQIQVEMAMSPGSKRGDAESKMRCRAFPSVYVAFLKWKIQSVVSVFFSFVFFLRRYASYCVCVCGVYGFLCRVPFIVKLYIIITYDFCRWFWCDCLFLFFGCIFKIHMTLYKSESCHLRIWIFQEVTFRPYDSFNVFFPLFARHDFIDLQPQKNIDSSVHMKAMVGQIGGMNLATKTVEFYTPWISVISRNVMEFKHADLVRDDLMFVLFWCERIGVNGFTSDYLDSFVFSYQQWQEPFPLQLLQGFSNKTIIHLFLVFQNHSYWNNLSWQTSSPHVLWKGKHPVSAEDCRLVALRCWCARYSTSCSKSWGRLGP